MFDAKGKNAIYLEPVHQGMDLEWPLPYNMQPYMIRTHSELIFYRIRKNIEKCIHRMSAMELDRLQVSKIQQT